MPENVSLFENCGCQGEEKRNNWVPMSSPSHHWRSRRQRSLGCQDAASSLADNNKVTQTSLGGEREGCIHRLNAPASAATNLVPISSSVCPLPPQSLKPPENWPWMIEGPSRVTSTTAGGGLPWKGEAAEVRDPLPVVCIQPFMYTYVPMPPTIFLIQISPCTLE